MAAHLNRVLETTSRVFRIASVLVLLPYIFWLVMSGHLRSSSHLFTLGALLVIGILFYHLLTSVRRCEGCSGVLTNFAIGPAVSPGKTFVCSRCGQHSVSAEGLVWYREVSG